ncbi:MAG: DUF3696 domain-containing protein [Bacteroidaceae bacterium]|nr:DUF3696 domain-containing protein [Bacteroidaceae bacterium]
MATLKNIHIRNYKAFSTEQQIEIRPVTVLIGKNSSGKSSILKLFPLFANATAGKTDSPLMLVNDGVSLGARYEELFHNYTLVDLSLGASFENGISFDVTYAIDQGNLFVYKYQVSKGKELFGEQILSKDTPSPSGMTFPKAYEHLGIQKADMTFKVDYIGPIRKTAPKEIVFEGFSNASKVGIDGSFAYSVLLNSHLKDDVLFKNVSQWFEDNLEGQKLLFMQNGPSTGSYSLYVKHNEVNVNISQVGQGLGQLLPIVVASYMKNDIEVLAIEQPALHLHPAAHANVAYRIAESAKKMKRKYVIESHSENFILGLRNMVADPNKDFNSEDVIIYFIDANEEESTLDRIEILPNGELTSWPTGIFSESFDLMSEIMEHSK